MGKRRHSDSGGSSGSEDDSDSSGSDGRRRRHRKSHKKHSRKKHKKHSKKAGKAKQESIELPAGAKPLTEDSFHLMNNVFSVWLKNKKHKAFDQLAGDDARRYFRKFVEKWNAGELSERYYDGEVAKGIQTKTRTNYSWGFAQKLKVEDQDTLDTVAHRVASGSTNLSTLGPSPAPRAAPSARGAQPAKPVHGPMAPSAHELHDYAQKVRQKDRRDYRKHKDMVIDELLPKATGFEAKLEKKAIYRQKMKERQGSPETARSVLMGESNSFSREIQRRKNYSQQKKERKAAAAREKLEAHQSAEKGKMQALLEMAKASKGANALWKT